MSHRQWIAVAIGAYSVRAFMHIPVRFWRRGRGIGATVARLPGAGGAGAQSAVQIPWNWYPPRQPAIEAPGYRTSPPSAIMTVLACATSTPWSLGKRAIGDTGDDQVRPRAHTPHAGTHPFYTCMRVQATPLSTTTPRPTSRTGPHGRVLARLEPHLRTPG